MTTPKPRCAVVTSTRGTPPSKEPTMTDRALLASLMDSVIHDIEHDGMPATVAAIADRLIAAGVTLAARPPVDPEGLREAVWARHPDCACDFDDEESDLCPFHQRMLGPLSWRTLAFMVIDLTDASRAASPAPLDGLVWSREFVPAPLDVERLARALADESASRDGTGLGWATLNGSVRDLWRTSAARIAREYAQDDRIDHETRDAR